MRRLPPADLRDGRDDPARQQASPHRPVLGRLVDGAHSNGISALQLKKQLGIGSYRSAWLLARKLRTATVDPERNPLSGLIKIDEASLPFRSRNDPPTGGQGRGHDGKMPIVGAIELGDGNIPARLRLAEISPCGADLGHFVETAAVAMTDGRSGTSALPRTATKSTRERIEERALVTRELEPRPPLACAGPVARGPFLHPAPERPVRL